MQTISYGGFANCARLVSGDVEAIVTLNVGPRVIRLGVIGERNEFHENASEMGRVGGNDYRSYGGHRFWVAPEDKYRTYHPENGAVQLSTDGDWTVFGLEPDPWGIRKEILMKPGVGRGFELCHRLTNQSSAPVELAPWTITVMAPGGVCLIPQSEFQSWPDVLTPVRAIALWSYTNMADQRFTWGKRLVQVKHEAALEPTKLGISVQQGYAGYYNFGNLFVKRFETQVGKSYPDFGCNFEAFTRHDMLEIESLGPLQSIASGQTVLHYEAWGLFPHVALPTEDEELSVALRSYVDHVTAPGAHTIGQ